MVGECSVYGDQLCTIIFIKDASVAGFHQVRFVRVFLQRFGLIHDERACSVDVDIVPVLGMLWC